MEVTDLELKSYIKLALKTQNLLISKIILTGSTEKTDGYASNILFATVAATAEDGAERIFEAAAKICRRNNIEIYAKVYLREAYFYENILIEFSRFQIQSNIENIFDSLPKCYKAISEENTVVIVMENLRKQGYRLYDRKKPLDLNHLKLVLREYGKFHAISFALRDKRREDFEKLVSTVDDIMSTFFKVLFRETINHSMKRACNILNEMGKTELYELYNKISEKGSDVAVLEVMDSLEPETAIIHGDCWTNNFLYKYENEDSRIPTKVAILDWQAARLHSPALDLSYFIYGNCSEEQLEHFDELLNVYYTSFSMFLREMGCDADTLFPYSTLLKHWKKYSLYGIVMVVTGLHVFLCDNEDAPDLSEIKDPTAMSEALTNVQIKNDVEYRKRLVAVLNHFYEYNKS